MNSLRAWRISFVGLLGVVLLAWVGVLAAAQWKNPGLVVSPQDVKNNIGKANWAVVDCRDLKDYAKGHIPGAISLGKRCKKALRDSTSRIFVDSSKYEKLFSRVGIGNNTHVVFYYGDLKTLTDATVGFWVMEYLGHDKVHLLNGGLDAWRKSGNRLDNKLVKKNPAVFKVKAAPKRYASTDEILKIGKGAVTGRQVIDSRTASEYQGKDVRSLRGGHVPRTTLNVSHLNTLAQKKNPKTGKMETIAYLDPDKAAQAFAKLDKNKRTIAYCQTGTRSTLTYLQLRLLGFQDAANWDESWTVYGSQLAYPVDNEQWYNFASMNKKLRQLEKDLAKLEGAVKVSKQ